MVPFTLDNVQNNRTSHKTWRTQPDSDAAAMLHTEPQRLYLGAAAETDRDIIHTTGQDARFPLTDASPFAGEGCSASPCSNVAPPPSTHSNTHTHAPGPTYHETMPAAEVNHIRRPLPQLIRYSPLAVSEGDPASCARLCIHSVTMRAARGSSTAQARVRGGGPAASF